MRVKVVGVGLVACGVLASGCASEPVDPQLFGAFAACKQEVMKQFPLINDLQFEDLDLDSVTWRGDDRVAISGPMSIVRDGEELVGGWDCRASRYGDQGDQWVAVVTIDSAS
jgi:hypothetical protein